MAWNPFDPYGTNIAYLNEDDEEPPQAPRPGTGGTPFLNYGVPGTSMPGEEGFVDPQGFWPESAPVAPPAEGAPMPQPPPNSPSGLDPNYDFFNSIYGLSPIPQIGEEILGPNPQINSGFERGVNEHWQSLGNNATGQIGDYYNWGDWPTMNASFFDTRYVPKTTAETPQGFEALNDLLSGQGFGADVLSRINAGATDAISREAASQRGAAKIRAEQAGLTGSGADLAIGGQIDRRAGDARTEALNKIAIEDANRGLENKRIGSGMELERRTSAAGMANQAALENAAREFAAMTQNVNNQQQTNVVNTENQQEKQMTRAGKQADFTSNSTGNYQNALLTKAADAETQNATNTINRNLNQAQLNRQRSMFNTGIGEGRYSQALGSMVSLAGGANPSAYNFNYQYQPNLIGANAFSNLANSFLNPNRQQNQN